MIEIILTVIGLAIGIGIIAKITYSIMRDKILAEARTKAYKMIEQMKEELEKERVARELEKELDK